MRTIAAESKNEEDKKMGRFSLLTRSMQKKWALVSTNLAQREGTL